MKINQKFERELLSQFNGIGFLDYEEVNNELSSFETVADKLDYLKDLKEKYGGQYNTIINSLETEQKDYCLNKIPSVKEIISNKVVSPLEIPESIYVKHFKDGLNDPEFTFWFLKYNANERFQYTINSKDFQSKINSNLKETLLNSDLLEICQEEKRVKKLLLNKELKIIGIHPNSYKYYNEIALLRVLDGNYYKENSTEAITDGLEIHLYFKHMLLKPHLENLLKAKTIQENITYKLKEIKIAFFCLPNKKISEENYLKILNKYSTSRSNKILQKPIVKSNQLTNISENKTADTKHLKALKNAKRLLSGIKNEYAIKNISQLISTFELNYKNFY